jgi:hypothetical protein
MAHCQRGPGPTQVNYMAALERWREAGEARRRWTATRTVGNPRRHDAPALHLSAGRHLQGASCQHERRGASFVRK